jgi:uncharacterized protein
MANRVVHFEIEAKDAKRAAKFYADAFGWNMDHQGEDFGGYVVVTTGDRKEPGGINGGIFQNDKKELNAYSCVVGVDDIDKAIADVKKAGGKVFDDNKTPDGKLLGEKVDIPGIGIYAKCEDTEGNRFTLLQPDLASMQNK